MQIIVSKNEAVVKIEIGTKTLFELTLLTNISLLFPSLISEKHSLFLRCCIWSSHFICNLRGIARSFSRSKDRGGPLPKIVRGHYFKVKRLSWPCWLINRSVSWYLIQLVQTSNIVFVLAIAIPLTLATTDEGKINFQYLLFPSSFPLLSASSSSHALPYDICNI